eukprot:6208643-Pleurochrysis_carterae.AAC.1
MPPVLRCLALLLVLSNTSAQLTKQSAQDPWAMWNMRPHTQWYMPDGRPGGCRGDRRVNDGMGTFEEYWATDEQDCRNRCDSLAKCVAYEYAQFVALSGKYYRCELHSRTVYFVVPVAGYVCWVKVPTVPPPPPPPPSP